MSAVAVFKDAWKNRDKMGDVNNTRELAAFLPAALEIQESPPNPLVRWLAWSLLILVFSAIIWASFGHVNIVASAEGKIIPSSRVKQIQPIENGVVKAVLVSEGEYVKKGQALVELDTTLTKADKQRLEAELHSVQMRLAVNQALLKLLGKPEAGSTNLTMSEVARSLVATGTQQEGDLHKRLLWQKWLEYRSQLQSLRSTLTKIQAEQGASKEVLIKLEQTLPIVTQRSNKLKSLNSKDFVSETDYLNAEQERIQIFQDLAAERQHLKQLQASEAEVNQQVNLHAAQTSTALLSEVSDQQRQLLALEEEFTKAQDINDKQILYAPVSGRVQELAVNTVGGVVTVAQQLMLIVPDEEALEVQVFLQNKDIGFVHEAMAAEIKIHTFPFTKYGVIEADVISVSNDATVDEKQGLIFGMQLAMKENSILVNGESIRLKPGMAVTAEVQTGERRIIEFFLAPLLRHRKESLRER